MNGEREREGRINVIENEVVENLSVTLSATDFQFFSFRFWSFHFKHPTNYFSIFIKDLQISLQLKKLLAAYFKISNQK